MTQNTDMRMKANGMLFDELIAAMTRIAERSLTCNAEGHMRDFVRLGIRGEKGAGGNPATLEELATRSDELGRAARAMMGAGLTRAKLEKAYQLEHLSACECCAMRDEYHRRVRMAEAAKKAEEEQRGNALLNAEP